MLNATDTNGPAGSSWSAQGIATGESATALRARLWDSTDVMQSVRAVRASGSPDEKGWAEDILRECFAFADQGRPGQYDKPQQRDAWDELAKRCAGVKGTSRQEISELVQELHAAAKSSTSTLHALNEAYERERQDGGGRWSTREAATITSALHGDDSLVRREAFNLLVAAIDDESENGDVRHEALLSAMADSMLTQPLSNFERLQRCARLPNCELPRDGGSTGYAGMSDDRETARLRTAYAAAFAKHLDAFAILAIR